MYFAVVRQPGPVWDEGRPMREQDGWAEHAAFMDALAEEGFIVLGGPVGDRNRFMFLGEAESEEKVRARLADDPWSPSSGCSWPASTHGRSCSAIRRAANHTTSLTPRAPDARRRSRMTDRVPRGAPPLRYEDPHAEGGRATSGSPFSSTRLTWMQDRAGILCEVVPGLVEL
jgi:hypothetical protein